MTWSLQLEMLVVVFRAVVGVGAGRHFPGWIGRPVPVGVGMRVAMRVGVPVPVDVGVTVDEVPMPVRMVMNVFVVVRVAVLMLVIVLGRVGRFRSVPVRMLVRKPLPVRHCDPLRSSFWNVASISGRQAETPRLS